MDLLLLKLMIKEFDFDIVNFPFLDGDVPPVLFMVYTFLNLLGSLVCNHVADCNARNKCLTAKLLQ